jgi:hypothetical protein
MKLRCFLRLSFDIIGIFKFAGGTILDYCRGDTPQPRQLVKIDGFIISNIPYNANQRNFKVGSKGVNLNCRGWGLSPRQYPNIR